MTSQTVDSSIQQPSQINNTTSSGGSSEDDSSNNDQNNNIINKSSLSNINNSNNNNNDNEIEDTDKNNQSTDHLNITINSNCDNAIIPSNGKPTDTNNNNNNNNNNNILSSSLNSQSLCNSQDTTKENNLICMNSNDDHLPSNILSTITTTTTITSTLIKNDKDKHNQIITTLKNNSNRKQQNIFQLSLDIISDITNQHEKLKLSNTLLLGFLSKQPAIIQYLIKFYGRRISLLEKTIKLHSIESSTSSSSSGGNHDSICDSHCKYYSKLEELIFDLTKEGNVSIEFMKSSIQQQIDQLKLGFDSNMKSFKDTQDKLIVEFQSFYKKLENIDQCILYYQNEKKNQDTIIEMGDILSLNPNNNKNNGNGNGNSKSNNNSNSYVEQFLQDLSPNQNNNNNNNNNYIVEMKQFITEKMYNVNNTRKDIDHSLHEFVTQYSNMTETIVKSNSKYEQYFKYIQTLDQLQHHEDNTPFMSNDNPLEAKLQQFVEFYNQKEVITTTEDKDKEIDILKKENNQLNEQHRANLEMIETLTNHLSYFNKENAVTIATQQPTTTTKSNSLELELDEDTTLDTSIDMDVSGGGEQEDKKRKRQIQQLLQQQSASQSSYSKAIDSERQILLDKIKELEIENANLLSENHKDLIMEENAQIKETLVTINTLLATKEQDLLYANNINIELENRLNAFEKNSQFERLSKEEEYKDQIEKYKSFLLDLQSLFGYIEEEEDKGQNKVNSSNNEDMMSADINQQQLTSNSEDSLKTNTQPTLQTKIKSSLEFIKQKFNETNQLLVNYKQHSQRLSIENESLIIKFNDLSKEHSRIEREFMLMKDERLNLYQNIKNLQGELNEYTVLANSQKENNNSLQQDLANVSSRLKEVIDDNCLKDSEIERLVELEKQTAHQLKKLEEELNETKDQLENLNSQKTQFESKGKEYLEQQFRNNATCYKLQEDLQSARNQITQLHTEISIQKELISQYSTQETLLEDLRNAIKRERELSKHASLEKDIVLDKSQELEQRISEQDEEISLLLKEKHEAQIQLVPLKEEIEKAKESKVLLDSLSDDYSQLKTLYGEKANSYEELNSKYSDKKSELSSTKQLYEASQMKIKSLEQLIEKHEAQFKSLEFSHQQMEDSLKKKDKLFEQNKLDALQLHKENADLKGSLDLLQSEQSQTSAQHRDRENDLNKSVIDAKNQILLYLKDIRDEKEKRVEITEKYESLFKKHDELVKEAEKMRKTIEVLKSCNEGTSTKDAELRTVKKENEYLLSQIEIHVKRYNELLNNNKNNNSLNNSLNSNNNNNNNNNNINNDTLTKLLKPTLKSSTSATTTTTTTSIASIPEKEKEKEQPIVPVMKTRKRLSQESQQASSLLTTSTNSTTSTTIKDENKKFKKDNGTPSSTPEQAKPTKSTRISSSPSKKQQEPQSKPIITLTGFTQIDKDKMIILIEQLGGVVKNENFDDSITHIVAETTAPTMRTLSGALREKWVVSTQWLLDSKKQGYFVPEQKYGERFLGKPFYGKKFFIAESFKKNPAVKEETINLVLTVGGAIKVDNEKNADYVLVSGEKKAGNHINYSQFLSLIPQPAFLRTSK